MTMHPLDRAFRKGLKHSSAVVPAGTWESIQAQLPVSRPSGSQRPFWMIGSALVLAMLTAFIFWPKSTTHSTMNPSPQVDPDSKEVLAITSDVDTHGRDTSFDKDDTAGNSTSENVLALGGDNSDKGDFTAKDNFSIANVSDIPETRPIGESSGTDHIPYTLNNESTSSSDNIVGGGQFESSFENTTLSVVDDNVMDDHQSEVNSPSEIVLAEEETVNHHDSVVIAPISLLKSEVKYESGIGLKVTDCYAFDKKSSGRFLLEIYTGPTFSLRSLSSKGENVDDYIEARDFTESSQLSWHAGLRVGYEHQSGITGRTGLHYTLVNEVFRQESRTIRTSIDSIFDSNGDLVRVDTIREIGTRTKQTQNRYHTIDIPLLIGYRIDNGNWDIGIQAGPVFNIAFNAKGDMIDPATDMAGSFSDESDPAYHPVFMDKIGMSIYAGVYASKRVGNNLWVFAEPHLQYRLKSITLDSYPVDQKQTNIGLSIGIRLKL